MKEIRGERVVLRERRAEDAEFFVHWFNQPRMMFQCGFTEETTLERERENPDSEDRDWYTITDLQGNIVGETGLLRMWPVWHCTDLTIILPDPATQGRGYGTEAIGLMLRLAFAHYGMNRVAIGVVAKNTDALRFYERVGFRREGIQEQGYYYGGEYSDFIMLRILRSEWEARVAAEQTTRSKGGVRMAKPKLILLSGSPCAGKTAVGRALFDRHANSAFLDGDWCWCVNPFSVEDPRLRSGDRNMSFLLSTYLNAAFDYVIFSSVVLTDASLREKILGDITAKDFDVCGFTLTCTEDTLRRRRAARGDEGEISFYWLRLPPYPTDAVIRTDGQDVSQIADELERRIACG